MWETMNPVERRNSERLGLTRTAKKLTNNLDRQRRIFIILPLFSFFSSVFTNPFFFLHFGFADWPYSVGSEGSSWLLFSLWFDSSFFLPIRMTLGLERQSIVFASSV
jgi:hypothetical protein